MKEHAKELERGERFGFGENWSKYLRRVAPEQIQQATQSLRRLLGANDLYGKRFLDIGSGSGLFSLAARTLGANVHSFDYDPLSVACTRELRSRYFADDSNWSVEEGSILQDDYVRNLGRFDVVYSWGVLHHTGAMWRALENAATLVAPRGQLAVAIYNDQGPGSRRWLLVKRTYCVAPSFARGALLLAAFARLWGPTTAKDLLRGRPGATWREYRRNHERGMSPWRDVVDWVGGYPFEVAKPEEVFTFFRDRGFQLEQIKTCGGGHGCNEFVFSRSLEQTI